jgi:hypothetical protein
VPAFVVGNLYVLVFVSTLVACIAHLRRLDRINQLIGLMPTPSISLLRAVAVADTS